MGETESFDLSQIPQLSKEHVHIKNIDAVKKKLRTIIEGESKLLQLITDFDRTLTKSKHDGVPTLSSHCIFESCKELPKYFRDGCKMLVEKYHPIEMAPNLTIEEKVPYMVEWWKQSEDLCCGLVIDRKTLDIAVGEANVKFRDSCKEVFVKLNEHSVPVLVFSAGLGDVIKSVLRHESLDYPNVHVISNFFRFEGSKIIGFEGPTIHIFNKNQEAVKNSEYFQEVKNRTNVILMGDSLGDANMAEGLPEEATILKIGYLSSNHNDEYLPQYMDHFDIVLVNDETMEIPMTIVNSVIP